MRHPTARRRQAGLGVVVAVSVRGGEATSLPILRAASAECGCAHEGESVRALRALCMHARSERGDALPREAACVRVCVRPACHVHVRSAWHSAGHCSSRQSGKPWWRKSMRGRETERCASGGGREERECCWWRRAARVFDLPVAFWVRPGIGAAGRSPAPALEGLLGTCFGVAYPCGRGPFEARGDGGPEVVRSGLKKKL